MDIQGPHYLLFSGTSHPALAEEVANHLGVTLGKVQFEQFPDGETHVRLLENVRGRDVFVFQTIALEPNHYAMELFILIDALKRASARSITAVMPYFGYCRQDRKDQPRVPITAKLVANLLESAGVDHVMTMDLHTGQVEGFFDVPVDHLRACPVLAESFKPERIGSTIVVAPDLGSVKLARRYAAQLDVDFAVVDKERHNSTAVEVITLIGDVQGKDVLLADDMCSTGGTLVSAAFACREKGAERIFAAVTHGLFVGRALEAIEQSPIEALFVSNTVPLEGRLTGSSKIRPVSVASLFGRAIHHTLSHESVSSLCELR